MNLITGPSGILGVATWQAFLILAVMIFGLSRVLRPFFNVQPVHPMRMLLFAVFSYAAITQGAELMREIEAWRSEAGSFMYDAAAASGGGGIEVPGSSPSDEPLNPPSDLDGVAPLRGWEAVATSYPHRR